MFVSGVWDSVRSNSRVIATFDDVFYLDGTGKYLVNVAFEVVSDVSCEWCGVREWAFTLIGESRGPGIEEGVCDFFGIGGVLDFVVGGVGKSGGLLWPVSLLVLLMG